MIHVYAAGGAEPLAARLAQVWAGPVADPFTPEWLAVPSDGMRRWLTLELARHLGASGSRRRRGGGQRRPGLSGYPAELCPDRRSGGRWSRSVGHRSAGVVGAGRPRPRRARSGAGWTGDCAGGRFALRPSPSHRRPVRSLPPAPTGHDPRLGGRWRRGFRRGGAALPPRLAAAPVAPGPEGGGPAQSSRGVARAPGPGGRERACPRPSPPAQPVRILTPTRGWLPRAGPSGGRPPRRPPVPARAVLLRPRRPPPGRLTSVPVGHPAPWATSRQKVGGPTLSSSRGDGSTAKRR